MNPTRQSLLEQLRFTEIEVTSRKALLGFSQKDVSALVACSATVEAHIDALVDEFYVQQTSTPEIAALIGDADTLERLQGAQRRYVLDLFAGEYGLNYVNNRLRIGLVHKRIGVEPKLYLSAVHLIVALLIEAIRRHHPDRAAGERAISALGKLIYFDVTLVFETYIQGMVSEINAARTKTEEYARALEATIEKRTDELRIDALTGLVTRRYLNDVWRRMCAAAQRRAEPISIVFVDVNGFKQINDSRGHAYGDEVLRDIGAVLKESARGEDTCIRYGGDEFCVVLANTAEQAARDNYCSRVNQLLRERLPEVSVSMGVVDTGPQQFEPVDRLLTQADKRMYAIKRQHQVESGNVRRLPVIGTHPP